MKMMIRFMMLAIVVLTFPGCFETKREVTLNPDGSGKVVYQIKQPLNPAMQFSMGDDKEKSSSETLAKKEVESILKNSGGVETWKDVSYHIDGDSKLVFKGTAYFKSFNDLDVGGDLKSGKNVTLEKDADGMLLTWQKDEAEASNGAENIPEEEMDKKVEAFQLEIKQFIGMMELMLKGFKDELTFHLPGKIARFNNVEKIADNSVSVNIDGDQMLAVLKELSEDTEAMRKAVEEGRNLKEDGVSNDYFNKKIFGNEGYSEVQVSGDMEALFDYEKEVAAAKEAFPEMTAKLGLEPIEISEPVALSANIEGKVKGEIHGESFELEEAYIKNGILHLRQGKDFFADKELVIFLFLDENEKLDGKKYEVNSGSQFGVPHVHMKYKVAGKNLPETDMFLSKYAMTLEFGQREGNGISGSINIVLPDEAKSHAAGNFVAEIKTDD